MSINDKKKRIYYSILALFMTLNMTGCGINKDNKDAKIGHDIYEKYGLLRDFVNFINEVENEELNNDEILETLCIFKDLIASYSNDLLFDFIYSRWLDFYRSHVLF